MNAIHIADNDGVTYVNVYRRSLSSSLNRLKTQALNLSLQVIETRKDSAVHVSLSSSSLVKQPGVRRPHPQQPGVPEDSHSTTNNNRLLSAVNSLILVRSFTGTKTCLGQGPRQRRAQWAVYKPAQQPLSTAVVNKSSHHPIETLDIKKPPFKVITPYLSHNPATF